MMDYVSLNTLIILLVSQRMYANITLVPYPIFSNESALFGSFLLAKDKHIMLVLNFNLAQVEIA